MNPSIRQNSHIVVTIKTSRYTRAVELRMGVTKAQGVRGRGVQMLVTTYLPCSSCYVTNFVETRPSVRDHGTSINLKEVRIHA